MRTVLHAIAMSLVVLAATVATQMQVNDVDHAVNHLNNDEQAVIQPADSSTSGR
ncbi:MULTISPECIES: hypothetical protein [unclassified Nocardioides]|uniref:hypothetical protein n=1 Tax=unclassified Nocardioides TaxID=2615069 RepID=UPI0013FDCDEC|nr:MULTISPECIES: hypothetical protein [unclassified Nocardioides]